MKKMLLSLWVLFLFAFGNAAAQDSTDGNTILFITRYPLAPDNAPAYGIFDVGGKPSVRMMLPAATGGRLQMQLHGKHYTTAAGKPFSLTVGFEDVTGRMFGQSPKIQFDTAGQSTSPLWFKSLEGVVGLYGRQKVDLSIPPGTAAIVLMGDDESTPVSPNQLVGYISHIGFTIGK